MVNLIASSCIARVDDGVIIIGFGDDEIDTQNYLLLQRSVMPTLQDRILGHDKVHIAFSSQTNSTYGGITRFVLRTGMAEIYFDDQAAKALGIPDWLNITFAFSHDQFQTLTEHLERMFEGEGVLSLLPSV